VFQKIWILSETPTKVEPEICKKIIVLLSEQRAAPNLGDYISGLSNDPDHFNDK